jgi:hypothetical protein
MEPVVYFCLIESLSWKSYFLYIRQYGNRHAGPRSGLSGACVTARPWQKLLGVVALLPMLARGGAPDARVAPEGLAASYAYLVSDRDSLAGALYRAREGPFKGLSLPYSFTDSARYWGAYVCQEPATNCAVFDYYDPSDYAIKPRPGPGAPLQTERINVHNGTNIYDAATWQIAVVLGAVVNRFGNALGLDAYQLASDQNLVLSQTPNRGDVPTGRRATTQDSLYVYNGARIADARSAYAFRMTAPAWLAPDPFKDSGYAKLIQVGPLPQDNSRYQAGLVAWSDWKPITGDNAWAFFEGPLQSAYIHFVMGLGQQFVPFADPAVQNALAVLPTFAAMQSRCGAVYYAPAGTLQNAADSAVNVYLVSIENNLSLLAGLRILKSILADELSRDASLTAEQKARISRSTTLLDTMLSGGSLPGERHTQGLKEFLHAHAWHDGQFVAAGYADQPGASQEWLPLLEPKAIDVNTWGVAVLGARQVDTWFGFGAAAQLWQSVKRWGAYGAGRTLAGVGYSDLDGNGQTPAGTFRAGVLSAEWTAGAIVMVRNMIDYYASGAVDSSQAARARELLVRLRSDERELLAGMQQLRFSRYLHSALPGQPADYATLFADHALHVDPYVYASRRYRIPFGWYANPLPSTSSTAWAILVADHYDPFGYGGKPN